MCTGQRSAENRINAFERGLHNKKTEGNESVSVREVEQPKIIARLGSQRKKSTVNSRIWASDHIEKHGMPELWDLLTEKTANFFHSHHALNNSARGLNFDEDRHT